ncbi:hypothetical protein H3221_016400 [Pseudomonas sp. LMG 31766]|jgi:hypothetical protein|uniref:Uncharacterized protein n=1 Tax=Pseudomonas chaetocerotis TaxID=2758695 RepID=A0A931GJ23_9PSED|nr:hypothetical protein [Pseudomonas chaetocerotis]MBZ9666325.1 hypothetical protein [Pseudomonas chaetocerotis]
MSEQERQYNDAPDDGMDWMLQNLIKVAEAGAGLPVTLTTTGGTVAGHLISGKEYIELVEQDLSNAVPVGGSTEIIESIVEWVQKLSPVFSSYDEGGAYFIHLKEARLDVAGRLVSTGRPWRGNLSHVTGFIIGTFN